MLMTIDGHQHYCSQSFQRMSVRCKLEIRIAVLLVEILTVYSCNRLKDRSEDTCIYMDRGLLPAWHIKSRVLMYPYKDTDNIKSKMIFIININVVMCNSSQF